MNETVAAVVVTYNRKQLLTECLDALLAQTRPVDKIILIDNASTDGTPDLLKERGYIDNPLLDYVRLFENTGGAGGFYEGLKRGYKKNYDFVWLMDDDCITDKNALFFLCECKKKNMSNVIFSSKVLWTNNQQHPMNLPKFKKNSKTNLRSASFVSILISRNVVKKYGYPLKKYFIWHDDTEYTSRILLNESGLFCSESLVIHKSATSYQPWMAPSSRYYYDVRNKIWSIKTSSFTFNEKIRIVMSLIIKSCYHLNKNRSFESIEYIYRGLKDGIKLSQN